MELSRQKLNLYWPLIPAGGLLLFCGWLLIGSSGRLPFTAKLLERECRRLETLRKNILDLREQNRQLQLETRPMTAIREGALAVDGDTAAALAAAGRNVFDTLQNNDAYHALQAVDGLIITGATGTNVNDVAVVLIGGEEQADA